MIIVKCIECNQDVELPVEQSAIDKWRNGNGLIQNEMPYLNEDQRELLMSGICGACFDAIFDGAGCEFDEDGVAF